MVTAGTCPVGLEGTGPVSGARGGCGCVAEADDPPHSGAPGSGPPKPKLLDRVRAAIRLRHFTSRAEEAYDGWIRRFILFHNKRHPLEMGAREVTAFLTSLAVAGRVSVSTQNQALSALLFLYREVLERDRPWMDEIVRAKRPRRLPTVLARDEVDTVIARLSGAVRLMALLQYGSGLRLLEACRLRVKDIDFSYHMILVRGPKGGVERKVSLAKSLQPELKRHLAAVRVQHERDLEAGAGCVELPHALARKYPSFMRDWGWQWAFRRRADTSTPRPASGGATTCTRSCSSAPSGPQPALPASPRRVTTHTLRHSYATDMLEDATIRTVQELFGHQDIRTSQIYTDALNRGAAGVRSPAEPLPGLRGNSGRCEHDDDYPNPTIPPRPRRKDGGQRPEDE